jgi:hypothetical protein
LNENLYLKHFGMDEGEEEMTSFDHGKKRAMGSVLILTLCLILFLGIMPQMKVQAHSAGRDRHTREEQGKEDTTIELSSRSVGETVESNISGFRPWITGTLDMGQWFLLFIFAGLNVALLCKDSRNKSHRKNEEQVG